MSAANGVVKKISKNDSPYYTAQDVMNILGVKRSKAYEVIKTLRQELIDSGQMNGDCVPSGKVPKKYLDKRCGL